MKRFTAYLIPAAAVLAALLSLSCEQQIDYVDATWARPVSPAEGSTLKIDFFKPDDKQVFTWEARPGATYKIAFDVDMHFENACVYDMGQKDSLVLTNSEMLDMLRTVWPDFSGVKRFFWRVEQTRGHEVRTSWRYFSAIPLVESFTDARDGAGNGLRKLRCGGGLAVACEGDYIGELALGCHLAQLCLERVEYHGSRVVRLMAGALGVEAVFAVNAVERADFAAGRHHVDAERETKATAANGPKDGAGIQKRRHRQKLL